MTCRLIALLAFDFPAEHWKHLRNPHRFFRTQ